MPSSIAMPCSKSLPNLSYLQCNCCICSSSRKDSLSNNWNSSCFIQEMLQLHCWSCGYHSSTTNWSKSTSRCWASHYSTSCSWSNYSRTSQTCNSNWGSRWRSCMVDYSFDPTWSTSLRFCSLLHSLRCKEEGREERTTSTNQTRKTLNPHCSTSTRWTKGCRRTRKKIRHQEKAWRRRRSSSWCWDRCSLEECCFTKRAIA